VTPKISKFSDFTSIYHFILFFWGGGGGEEGVLFIFVISKKLEKLLKFSIEKIKSKRNPNFLLKGNNRIFHKKYLKIKLIIIIKSLVLNNSNDNEKKESQKGGGKKKESIKGKLKKGKEKKP